MIMLLQNHHNWYGDLLGEIVDTTRAYSPHIAKPRRGSFRTITIGDNAEPCFHDPRSYAATEISYTGGLGPTVDTHRSSAKAVGRN